MAVSHPASQSRTRRSWAYTSALLALDGDLAKAGPKTLRYRIFHAGARLARSGRRQRLKISATWPWAPAIVAAREQITALPQAP